MYISTRQNKMQNESYSIIQGLSKDGGLFIPQSFNTSFFNNDLLKLDYHSLSKLVNKQFLDDFDSNDINTLLDQAYNTSSFKPLTVVLKSLDRISFLELFHGPTFAFKDMALQVLPLLMNIAKKIQNDSKKTIILTATSGDTGGATLSGFSHLPDTHVIVLYPKSGVSDFQEKQMLQYASDNCHVLAVDGNFDDCQRIVKDIFSKVNVTNSIVSSANSINIGRIIPQTIYYFYAYLESVRNGEIKFGDFINFVVPTGNFGNIYAAYVAKKMGLPVNKLIIASNANNVLTELFNTGVYRIDRDLIKTSSPSMDIIVSSNFERLLYDLVDQNPKRVVKYMKDLQKNKSIYIKELKDNNDFYATYATESETLSAIKTVYDQYDYLIDPHTAVAYHCYETYKKETSDDTKTIIVSTASPYKFSGAVLDALHLPKTNDLEKDIITLKKIDKAPFDERIMDVLSCDQSPQVIALDKTYAYVMKVIGEIDAND